MTKPLDGAFTPPLPWAFYLGALATEDEPCLTGVVNTMRLAHGLPVVGHGMTYDFMVLNESARRTRGV